MVTTWVGMPATLVMLDGSNHRKIILSERCFWIWKLTSPPRTARTAIDARIVRKIMIIPIERQPVSNKLMIALLEKQIK
jgi:hypothetical protein